MRRHFIELHEQTWCPKIIRDCATDYLEFIANLMGVFDPIRERLGQALRSTKSTTVIDMCSGGSGPWLSLLAGFERANEPTPEVVLTDLFPNEGAQKRVVKAHHKLVAHPGPVNALDVPEDLDGFRIIFNGFHHFKPADAEQILRDAVQKGQPVGIFESLERRAATIIPIALLSPWLVLVLTPMIRPFRLSRLLLTYIIPVLPLLVAFDGVVSAFRIYDIDEMKGLAQRADPEGKFEWDIGITPQKAGPTGIPYIIGTPRKP